MPITWRDVSTGAATGGNTVTVNKPSVLNTNDVMVCNIGVFMPIGSVISDWTLPTGWIEVPGGNDNGAGGTTHYTTLYKVVTDGATEPASYSFTYSGQPGDQAAVIAPAVGVDNNGPLDTDATLTGGNSNIMNIADITTATNNAAYVAAGMQQRAGSLTYNAPLTGLGRVVSPNASVSAQVQAFMAYMIQATAGATGIQTINSTQTRAYLTSGFALKPHVDDFVNPTVTIDPLHGAGPVDDIFQSGGYDPTTDTLTIAGTADDSNGSGVSHVNIRIDGGAWVRAEDTIAWGYTVDVSGWTAGEHTIEAQAVDFAGNLSTIASTTAWYNPSGVYGAAATSGEHLVPVAIQTF